MRIIVDANVWLGYLATRKEEGTLKDIVRICTTSTQVALLMPLETIAEIEKNLEENRYFRRRIHNDQWIALRKIIEQAAMLLPRVSASTQLSRDPKDEYLLVAAKIHQVDHVVTGDKDLLVDSIREYAYTVTPREFWEKARTMGLLE